MNLSSSSSYDLLAGDVRFLAHLSELTIRVKEAQGGIKLCHHSVIEDCYSVVRDDRSQSMSYAKKCLV